MSSHSILPPSSAATWVNCPGWALMVQSLPKTEDSGTASNEGSAAHWVGEQLINNFCRAMEIRAADSAKSVNDLNEIAPEYFYNKNYKGVAITPEIFEAANIYAMDVIAELQRAGVYAGNDIGIERKLKAPSIHPLSEGTPDAFLFDRKHGVITLWDYKHGFNSVEAFENWQAINYFAGIIDVYGIDGHQDQFIRGVIKIVQPRDYQADGPIKTWSFNLSDLRGYFNRLRDSAAYATNGKGRTITGPHCRYCEARHVCPAAMSCGLHLYEVSTEIRPHQLDADKLGPMLDVIERAKKQIEYLETGLTEQIESIIKSGGIVPGYALQPTSGRQKWNKPTEDIFKIGDLLGVELRKKEAITPKQAIKAGVPADVINQYSERPRNGLKLIKENIEKARRIFK